MRAELLLKERLVVSEGAFVEMVVWRVPSSVKGSRHDLKYRLAFIVDGDCVLRYDNEAGEGDHRHLGQIERPYLFVDAETLISDFWADVDRWSREHDNRDP